MLKKVLFSLALILLVTTKGFTQLKAIESFDYPAGTSLDTLTGNGGSGWNGAWDLIGGNTEILNVVDTGFVYSDLNYPVPHVGKHLLGANPNAWGWQRIYRKLAQRWPNEKGKVYWISSLFEVKNFTTSGWALITLYDNSEGLDGGLGHGWGNDTLGLNVTGGHTKFTGDDGPQWFVAKIYASGDSLSNVYLWVSPDPLAGEPDTNKADAKGKWKMPNGFDGVVVHFGGEGVGMTMAVDEIRLGESWNDVSSPIQTTQEFKAIESFNYSDGTSLDSLAGNGGTGWAGPWDLFSGNSEVMSVMTTGFNYTDLNFPVAHTGNLFKGANPVAWQFQRYGRYLSQRWPNEKGKVYWLSTLYELQDFTTNGWALVGFFDGATEKAGIGHEWGNDTIGVAVYNPAGHSKVTVNDGPQWLVAKVVMSGDTLSQVYLWVTPDPNGGEPDTSNADAKGKWNLVNGFDRVAIHWGGEGVGMTMAVDEIRLGTTWADVSSPLTAVEKKDNKQPNEYALSQNYPNPFNPNTKISFSIKTAGFVKLNVYNVLGQHVTSLVNENLNIGTYERSFNAAGLPSGIYIYKLEAGNKVFVNKMMLLK